MLTASVTSPHLTQVLIGPLRVWGICFLCAEDLVCLQASKWVVWIFGFGGQLTIDCGSHHFTSGSLSADQNLHKYLFTGANSYGRFFFGGGIGSGD